MFSVRKPWIYFSPVSLVMILSFLLLEQSFYLEWQLYFLDKDFTHLQLNVSNNLKIP